MEFGVVYFEYVIPYYKKWQIYRCAMTASGCYYLGSIVNATAFGMAAELAMINFIVKLQNIAIFAVL